MLADWLDRGGTRDGKGVKTCMLLPMGPTGELNDLGPPRVVGQ